MAQKPQKTIVLVDYENVRDLDLTLIKQKDIQFKIFVGQSQNKLPFDLVKATQTFGRRIEWIKVDGIGENALDFHIAFYLGKFCQQEKNIWWIILSQDKGFDPLIKYIDRQKINCKRIQNLSELQSVNETTELNPDLVIKIIDKLAKIEKNKRPKTIKALKQHINSIVQKKIN